MLTAESPHIDPDSTIVPLSALGTEPQLQIANLLEQSQHVRLTDGVTSLALADQALGLAQQLPNHEQNPQYSEALIELAAAAQAVGKHSQALSHIHQAQALLSDQHTSQLKMDSYMVLGTVYISIGEYSEALNALQIAQTLARSSSDTGAEAEILCNIGLAHGWMQTLDKAQEAFTQALTLSEDGRMRPVAKALLLGNMSYLHMLLKDFSIARSYAVRGLALAEAGADRFNEVVIHGTLSEIDTAEGALDQAEQHLEQARVISDISGSQRLRTENLRGWARLYSARQQPEQAIQTFESCLQIAQEHNVKPVIQECLRGLAQLYEQQGQPAQALHYLKIYGDLKDTATRERVDMRIEALEEAHRVSLLQQEHAAVQQENMLLEQIVQERNQSLSMQQQLLDRIAELSTPVLPLFPDVLVVPLIGVFDHVRAARMHTQLLETIAQLRAHVLLLDITGVLVVDTEMALSLMTVVSSARLLGCEVVMVGIRPEIAQALVSLGVNLNTITTQASLESGLRTALHRIGRKIVAR